MGKHDIVFYIIHVIMLLYIIFSDESFFYITNKVPNEKFLEHNENKLIKRQIILIYYERQCTLQIDHCIQA